MADHAESEESDLQEPLHPWGKRVSFRAMLEGGAKKLVLEEPPFHVSNFFKRRVFRSTGCTYDDRTRTFFATEPGRRGEQEGRVLAMDGNAHEEPYVVAEGLDEPAAIAVYQPGESLAVVTFSGIFVLERREEDAKGAISLFDKRQISCRRFQRGIAVSAGGGIVSFCRPKIFMYDGEAQRADGNVLAEVNYDTIINKELFTDNPNRRYQNSNCCFMDIVGDQLVMSDLSKHVISLWQVVDKTPNRDAAITFVGAIDVSITCNPYGSMGLRGDEIPNGKIAYASGIRLDAEGWVLCADAEGRNLTVFDDRLRFVTRIEPSSAYQLPYVSGLYMSLGGHLMVCDRRDEKGGLCVFLVDAIDVRPSDDRQRRDDVIRRPSDAAQRSLEEEEQEDRERDAASAALAAACAAPYRRAAAAAARARYPYEQPRAAAAATAYHSYSAWEPMAPTAAPAPRHIPTEPAAHYAAPAAGYSTVAAAYSQSAAAAAAAPYQSAARYPPMDTPYLPIPDYYAGNYQYYQR